MKSIFQYHFPKEENNFIANEYIQDYFDSPFHFHDSYELILIARSYGKLYAGNKVLNFSDGEIFLFGPRLPHCFYNDIAFKYSDTKAHAIVIFFKQDFLGQDFLNFPEFKNIKILLEKSSAGIKVETANDNMRLLFHTIVSSKGMEALLPFLQLLHVISGLKDDALLFINNILTDKPTVFTDSTKLDCVFKYVSENFKDELNSRYAAHLCSLNEAAFCRYFKRRTGKTFSQFVNYVRITHSQSLLKESEWSIAGICYECGFKNISYFNRKFKELITITPLEYRKVYQSSKNMVITQLVED